jgi:hypothetical protein
MTAAVADVEAVWMAGPSVILTRPPDAAAMIDAAWAAVVTANSPATVFVRGTTASDLTPHPRPETSGPDGRALC